jgi:hypothetical protein
MKATNQWQEALYYLINWNEFSIMDLIQDSMFIKFQTRLSEIENEHGVITSKERKDFVNRFNKKSNYVVYKCTDKEKAKELFKLYERESKKLSA